MLYIPKYRDGELKTILQKPEYINSYTDEFNL